MALVHITDSTFDEEVLKSKIPVLVDFWAPWCGPCKMLGPVLEEVEKEVGEKVTIAKINVDENNLKAQALGILSIPTMMLFVEGKMVDMVVGFRSKEEIIGKLSKYMEKAA